MSSAWEPCASPHTLRGLENGPFTFQVRATDPAGNNAAAARFFTVGTAPVVRIPDGPVGSPTTAIVSNDGPVGVRQSDNGTIGAVVSYGRLTAYSR